MFNCPTQPEPSIFAAEQQLELVLVS